MKKPDEYFIGIEAAEALQQQVDDYRNRFSTEQKLSNVNMPRLYMLLYRFHAYSQQENCLIASLETFARQAKPLLVTCKGWQPLPSHSILWKTASQGVLPRLVKEISAALQPTILHSGPYKAFKPSALHFNFLKSLNPHQFEGCWLYMQHLPMDAKFLVTEILVSKKSAGAEKLLYQKRLLLENQPVQTAQGQLF